MTRQLGLPLKPEELTEEECKTIILQMQKELDKKGVPFTKATPHPEVKF